MQFCTWIYRLTSLATDLIDYPFEEDPNPAKRRLVVKTFLRHKAGTEYECYFPENWRPVLAVGLLTPIKAEGARVRDACMIYERFLYEIKPASLLEKFLMTLADSFYRRLCETGLVKRCPECHKYFPYKANKKRCSLVSEGRSCAKKSHNRQFYKVWRQGKS